jgi:general secretion pathway protein D
VQVFYVSHADATEVNTAVQTILNQFNIGTRPVLTPNKTANSIMARASIPVMQVIERLIQANDKPRAEVVIDVEILEVDRKRAASYGLNLSAYQLGFTFSPEAAPSSTGGAGAFNLNTVSQGISMADFYLTVPTATIKALESDSRTKVLARPSLRGTEDQAVTLNLGDQIPVPTTTFSAVAAGGIATTPSTSFNLRDVGVNVSMKPHVTYDNEIRIELTVENSAKGPDVQVAGQALPSFSSRKVTTVLRLRDGESNLLAGLLREEDTKSVQGLPGINKIPLLRSLFGGSEKSTTTSDIVMIITPRIVRGHELNAEDLGPIYVGTQQNFGLTGPPALIAPPTAEEIAAAAGAIAPQSNAPATPVTATPPAGAAGQPPAQSAAGASRAPVVVPVTPVTNAPAASAPPPAAPRVTTVALAVPGAMQVGGGPYTLPVQIADATQLGSITLSITYDPKVLKAASVAEGAFLKNGNVPTVFTPKIDVAAGRVDITISRPAGAPGVSGSGLLGGVIFETTGAGPANIRVTASGSANGQAVAVQVAPISVVVR